MTVLTALYLLFMSALMLAVASCLQKLVPFSRPMRLVPMLWRISLLVFLVLLVAAFFRHLHTDDTKIEEVLLAGVLAMLFWLVLITHKRFLKNLDSYF